MRLLSGDKRLALFEREMRFTIFTMADVATYTLKYVFVLRGKKSNLIIMSKIAKMDLRI